MRRASLAASFTFDDDDDNANADVLGLPSGANTPGFDVSDVTADITTADLPQSALDTPAKTPTAGANRARRHTSVGLDPQRGPGASGAPRWADKRASSTRQGGAGRPPFASRTPAARAPRVAAAARTSNTPGPRQPSTARSVRWASDEETVTAPRSLAKGGGGGSGIRSAAGTSTGGFAGFMLEQRPERTLTQQPSTQDILNAFAAAKAQEAAGSINWGDEEGGGEGLPPSPPTVDTSRTAGSLTAWGTVPKLAPLPPSQSMRGDAGGRVGPDQPGLRGVGSYRVNDNVPVVEPGNFFKGRDLAYHPKSVARTLRTAMWACVALLVFGLFVVGVALFIVHGVYGLRYSFATGALSMEEAVVVTVEGRVGLHTSTPYAGVELNAVPGEGDTVLRMASPVPTDGGPTPVVASQIMEFGAYAVEGEFEPSAVWQASAGLPLALNASSGIALSSGANASIVFTSPGFEDSGSVTVGPQWGRKLQVDGAVTLHDGGAYPVTLHAAASTAANSAGGGQLVVGGRMEVPELSVTGNTFLGTSVSNTVQVGGTLNVTGAIDLRHGTLLLEDSPPADVQRVANIVVGVLNVTALNFEQKHLTLVNSLDVGSIRSDGSNIYGSAGAPPVFTKPIGGGVTSVAVAGAVEVKSSGSEEALSFARDDALGSVKLFVPAVGSASVVLPNNDGTLVVAATAPHLAVDATGTVTFDQTQVVATGALAAGSIVDGFGTITTSSAITTTGAVAWPDVVTVVPRPRVAPPPPGPIAC